MHCILIGVTKKLLMFWTGGIKPQCQNLPKVLISDIDTKLNELGQYVAQDFHRNPNENSRKHPLRDVTRWKATELRQCLLYTGMVVFHNLLEKKVYSHFIVLCVAKRIMSTDNISEEYILFAKKLLNYFMSQFADIYGNTFMSHNIHIMLHLADDVQTFGSLNNFSAFPFESFMQPLKKKIKSGVKPLQQLARRYAESRIVLLFKNSLNSKSGSINVHTNNKHRPLLQETCKPEYTGWKNDKFIVKLNNADNCFMVENGDIILIENIATSKSDHSLVVIGRRYEKLTTFFNTPCSSKLLSIHL